MLSDRPVPTPQALARNSRPFLKGMGLALSLIVPIVVVTASSGTDPESAGELAGELSVAPFLGGVAVGVWAKLATRRWRWIDYALRFVVCTVAFFGLNAFGRRVITAATSAPASAALVVPLTESEKRNLFVGRASARHADFGFTFNLPGTFGLVPEIQNEVNRHLAGLPGTFAWALQDPGRDEIILIYVAKGLGNDERDFRAMARGMSRGISKQAVQVFEDEVRWDRRAREFRHAARLGDGSYAKMRCLPSPADRNPPYVNPPYIVCVQTVSPDSTGLDDSRSHLKVPSWR